MVIVTVTEAILDLVSTVCQGCFPGGSVVKNLLANARDAGSIPRSGRFPGEENGNPLQCSCLENPRDGGAWGAAVYGVKKESDMTERVNNIMCQALS